MKNAEENFGPIDVLINNCGGSVQGGFLDLPVDSFEAQLKLNVLSAILVTRAALPSMIEKKRGRIAFVSSVAGQVGVWGYSAYSAGKYALRGFAETLQMEVRMNIQ